MEKTQVYKYEKNFHPILRISDRNGYAQDIIIKDKMLIGRPTAEKIPDIPLYSQIVSREHGEIGIVDHKCFYRDLGSHNGTWINGIRCEGIIELKDGDVLSIRPGNCLGTTVEYELIYIEAKKEKNIIAEDSLSSDNQSGIKGDEKLQIHIQKREAKAGFRKKTLLKDIHLNVSSGEMVLILGGSGAGKTTFINAVMGYEEAEGEIFFAGKNVYEDYEELKYEIAYVPQQDLVRGTDTVWGTLCNAAEMRMPANTPHHEQLGEADYVLELFGLERERETLVSKLSGGQRKRLSIATEYIGNPSLFFLDEPDSGLDGIMARSLMENLREIADMGKMVMVISHSPDRAADLFDKIIVLAKSEEDDSGHLAFYGSPNQAKTFFGTDSLEGIVKRVNRLDEGGDGLADYYIKMFDGISR